MNAPARPLIVRTFMTHDMKDEDIAALSTGREEEFCRIMDAVARSRQAAPGPLQHVVLYGSRGFGKSFMTRRVQIAVAAFKDDLGPVRFVLLPEEQHNLERSPHALLNTITQKLAYLDSEDDKAYEAVAFKWPKPGEEAKLWEEAATSLEAEIDKALPGGKGLVIVAIENFDTLLATLFKNELDEQRLRAWLDRPKNRSMLFATATGTVDIDYDKPLFHAFQPLRLAPWAPEDCIAYFNKRRDIEGRKRLDSNQEAKARAIADFIGGTPRLAQLLAEVLDTEEALTVAETMTALADKLAEYYRRRIEDLPPLASGLLDTLIRQGEPASATELARRVGADQSVIARSMGELQEADILRGQPARDSRETLYRVTDRVFVHYFRLRQGSRAAQQSPLTTILEFLKSFYSRDEQRQQALRHLQAGRPAEADLFSRLAMDGSAPGQNVYTHYFAYRLRRYLAGAPNVLGMDAEEIEKKLNENAAACFDHCGKVVAPIGAASALCSVVKAQALTRMGLKDPARQELERAVAESGGDSAARVIAGDELARLLFTVFKDNRAAAELGLALQSVAVDHLPPSLALRCALMIAWSLGEVGRHDEALEAARRATQLAAQEKDAGEEARSLRYMAFSLGGLGRHEEAVETARRAVELAAQAKDAREEAETLRHMAFSLGELGRHEEAVETARRAAELAAQAKDIGEEDKALRCMAVLLVQLGRHEEAVETARRAAKLVALAKNIGLEAEALQFMASSLSKLGRHEEALETARRAAELAAQAKDGELESASLREMTYALSTLARYEEALETARRWAEVAKIVGDKFEEGSAHYLVAFCLRFLGRGKEAWTAATTSAALAREIDDKQLLFTALEESFFAADIAPRREAIAIYEEWLNLRRAPELAEERSRSSPQLRYLFIIAARVRAFAELDALLQRQSEPLADEVRHFFFSRGDGQSLARIAESDGRAAAFEAISGLLPRVAAFMAKLPAEKRDKTWLPDLISGFASMCRDPGLLRDVATLLTGDLAPQASLSAKLLRALADVDEAKDAETALARMDPDVATLIRRLRDLPDPAPIPPKRTTKRPRKRPG